ncbi:hypothetical protein E2C01_031480 [Portunus trituberculatus]|uniref:Uncharacterized protein n=1 Tax=Portunus trituberculatus TaxID=210409 RepID=A0A5B7F068_PORTR|nr:hypothetical protein [Portunus trituberculatus]
MNWCLSPPSNIHRSTTASPQFIAASPQHLAVASTWINLPQPSKSPIQASKSRHSLTGYRSFTTMPQRISFSRAAQPQPQP